LITLTAFSPRQWTESHGVKLNQFLNSSTELTESEVITTVSETETTTNSAQTTSAADEPVTPKHHRLFLYHDPTDHLLIMQSNVPAVHPQINEIMYFIKPAALKTVNSKQQLDRLQIGKVSGNIMESLLSTMNGIYVPAFAKAHWPDSVRKEFNSHLSRLMAFLTDATHKAKGNTVLYVPADDISQEAALKDKDLMSRYETLIVHWTRQIKHVVSNQHTSESEENLGPLAEIQFWRSRYSNLSGISEQLNRSDVQVRIDPCMRS